MKKNSLFILLAGFAIALLSCCDKDKPTPLTPPDLPVLPVPEVKSEYSFNLKSSEIMEFNQIDADKNQRDIPKGKLKEYWGKRIANSTPVELQFKKDSLQIVKPNDVVEKYKIEWRGDDLYLYNSPTDTWLYCGKQNGKKQFLLNTGFCKISGKNKTRSLQIMRQEYALKAQSELGNYPQSTIVWLKMYFLFDEK